MCCLSDGESTNCDVISDDSLDSMEPLHGSEPLSVERSPEPLFDAGTEVSTVSLCVNDHPGDVSSVEGGCLGSVVSLGFPFPFSEVKF